MLTITRAFLILTIFVSFSSKADNTNIMKMYNQFTAVSAASGKCMTPSKKELSAFLANYQMVTTLMLQEIKKLKPDYTDEQAKKALKMGSDKISTSVYSIIETESCESPKIQDLIKRFHLQTNWKPSA